MKRFTFLLSWLIFCVPAWGVESYLDSLQQAAQSQQLADDPAWLRLLHYRRNLFGLYESDIDDKEFFLSPRGRRDPRDELKTTLAAFFEPTPVDPQSQSAGCRYPARYAWLKERIRFDLQKLPEPVCPRFDAWRQHLQAGGVTMVFASYYMNNPSSMYGHTFLRLNGIKSAAKPPLLNYTVNFAADANTRNGLVFALYGLTGQYRGRFSTMPYYMKVQEYNNLESRDLWEYRLNLSDKAVQQFVRHAWEMGQTSIAYYFLNRNCSYQLLPMLEVAEPTLNLTRRFIFKAIPMDTLRAVLEQPNLVAGITLRPSHVSQMLARRARLRREELPLVESLAVNAGTATMVMVTGLPPERQAMVLDSAYDLFRYRHGFTFDQAPVVKDQESRLLRLRNNVALSTTSMTVQESKGFNDAIPPDQGHRTGRVGLSYGVTTKSHFEELSIRPAAHDQDDASLGYIPGSQLHMFNFKIRYDKDRKTGYLQEFSLIDLKSYSPWDRWMHHPAWQVGTGLQVAQDLAKDPENSLHYDAHGGSGIAFHTPLSRESMAYALAVADVGVGAPFRDYYRFGGGGTAGLWFDLFTVWRMHIDATYLNYPLGDPMGSVRLSFLSAIPLGHWGQWRVQLSRQNDYKEVLNQVLVYW